MTKRILLLLLVLLTSQHSFAQESTLSVEKIMQDPLWMGTFPTEISWGVNSENIYFMYNPEANPSDSLYRINIKNTGKIIPVDWKEQNELLPKYGDFNKKRTKKVYSRNGSLFIFDLKRQKEQELLDLGENISEPKFLANENLISFVMDKNAYLFHLDSARINKLTNIKSGEEKEQKEEEISAQDEWLKQENLELLQVIKQRKEDEETSKNYREITQDPEAFTFYAGKKRVSSLEVSPDARYVTFNLTNSNDKKDTKVPDYTNASGYTVDLTARKKVGGAHDEIEMAIYDLRRDSVYMVETDKLPGIKDLPDYIKDYPDKEWKEELREVIPSGPYFSENGKQAVINIRSWDNKDRWIALLDLKTGKLSSLDRQRDEAWIAGPGIGWTFSGGNIGWLPDNETIYFQSEQTGYSHLYLLHVNTGEKKQLTSGEFEVFKPFLSRDRKSWFLTASKEGPGERHFYKMPVKGGKMQQLTELSGNNEVYLSPNENYMAIRYSYSNKPWELYLKKTSAKAVAKQLTSGQSKAFSSYDWRDPELVKFEAEDGTMVPARLYTPSKNVKNGAAVIFVHGAGYLQNVHKWWSTYFREYMFHNLLSDLGYTVLDIDYRGSAGYGRDWRTAIYRHMGGKDLSDQIDGAHFLVADQDIDPERIGIYGGSYGGFITLMAMFTETGTFKSGAALRSVTDWAHYNHGYTSNILNEPVDDPIAYRRSSPIYFAEGLEGNLLIAHGMTDTNVHFQDVVRLVQRLIELGKEDWELAVFPVEKHGFVEPSSWTDEYRRILELFNETLQKK